MMKRFRAAPRLSSEPELVESAVRRTWVPSALLVAVTTALGILSYSLSMQVASERRGVEHLAAQNASLSASLKSYEAELRVRMRLPQLQRWNDEVLGLVPINATQYLDAPVSLASYATPPEAPAPAKPQVQYAVRDLTPAQPAQPAPAVPQLRQVKAEQSDSGNRDRLARKLQLASAPDKPAAAPMRAAPLPAGVQMASYSAGVSSPGAARRDSRPEQAPADLLAQIDLAFGPPGQSADQ